MQEIVSLHVEEDRRMVLLVALLGDALVLRVHIHGSLLDVPPVGVDRVKLLLLPVGDPRLIAISTENSKQRLDLALRRHV
eukprot:746872-Hanusia_phi.AAC.2